MADQRISELNELSKAGVAANDALAIADVSGSETKKVTVRNLTDAGLDLIPTGSVDLDKLDQTTSSVTLSGAVLTNATVTLGKVQNIATNTLLGRSSSGPGVIEQIALTAAGRALLDDANAAAQRATLGLGTGDTLTFGSVTASITSPNVTITGGSITGITDLAIADGGTGASNSADARQNMGLVINTDIQAFSASLASIAALSTAANQGIYQTGSNTYANFSLTAAGRALLDDADAAAQRTTLGLGTVATLNTVNAGNISSLIAASGITATELASNSVTTDKVLNSNITFAKIQNISSTDRLLGRVSTGAGVIEEIVCTAAGRALLDDADAAAQRTTLGLGTLATQSGTFSGTHSGTSSGTNTGDQTITLSGAVSGTGTGAITTTLGSGVVGTANIAADAVTFNQIQDTSGTNVLLGRQSAGGGTIEEITCTSAGRDLLNDASASDQRATLGLGSLAVVNATVATGATLSGSSSGTNTGDQTITLTGPITGSGTGSFATSITDDSIAASHIQGNAITTAKINPAAVDATKIGNQATCIVAAASPSGSGAFVGQAWYNSSDSKAYRWIGSAWVQEAGIQDVTVTDSTPLAISVNNPDAFTANLTISLDTQTANTVFVGPSSGNDAQPTFRALLPADLPDATSTAKGIIQPGTGLAVTSGVLNHTNNVTGATVSGITFTNEGHISAATALVASDIPDLDADKITTGEFGTARIQNDAVTAPKLANYSTARFGETLGTADYIGQLHVNPLTKTTSIFDGNVFIPIGITSGAISFVGTYNAALNQIDSVTDAGTALGFSVGSSLPAASSSNVDTYFVVSVAGTGASPAPTVSLQPPDLLLSTGSEYREIDVSTQFQTQSANQISVTPAGDLGGTNVQLALEELSTELRNADNLTSGTVDVDHGGTNIASYTKGDLLVASAATTLEKLGSGTNSQILSVDTSTATGLAWINNQVGTVTSVTATAPLQVANGTTTPALSIAAGSTTAAGVLQLTNSTGSGSTTTAATPASVKTAFDLANSALQRAGGTFTGQLLVGNTGSLVFEGATDNAFELTLTPADPTADRVLTLPDVTDTLATVGQLDDGVF